jgi:DNA-binding SARP family transcriptional activator/tetratricopeptide (TPR) repeat protein
MTDAGTVFGILGSTVVRSSAGEVKVGEPRRRAVLGVLLLDVGHTVPIDRLAALVWEDRRPPTARKALQVYVSQLRRAMAVLPDVELVTERDAYRLACPPDAVDLHLFRRLVRVARAEPDPGPRRDTLRRALRLWRGPAFADVGPAGLQHTVVPAIEEERLAALEDLCEVELATGTGTDVIGPLMAAVAEHPLRERMVGLLMTALHRSGRDVEAATAFRTLRRRLVEEGGMEPGPALVELHRAVLANDPLLPAGPSPRPAAAAWPVPAQLPAAPSGFVGRAGELRRLDAAATRGDAGPAAVVISAVSGAAGVGKTALALHWAHRMAGRFPDGRLYVDLRGFDPGGRVVDPGDALRGFLAALGAPADSVPADFDAQAALYRSLLAGRRVLVVLDNARDAAQVRPLLPGTPGCLVVVTSRDQLTPLVAAGAQPIRLDVLSAAEANELLARRLGAERVAAEPGAADQITVACARLPLALGIAAARAQQTGFPLAVLAGDLDDAAGRLDLLDTGDPAGQITAVFSWSYAALTAPAARLFRLLGLHPGPDVSVAAAASLAGHPVRPTRRLLTELTRASLLTEHRPGRFAGHDLLRLYARDLTRRRDTDEQRRAALTRLLDQHLHAAHAADRQVHPRRAPIPRPLARAATGAVRPRFADGAEATAWLEAEHLVLLAAQQLAADAGFDTHVWQLAWTVDTFLDRSGRWTELAAAWRTALTAADRLGDTAVRACAHRLLARVNTRLDHRDTADDHHGRALDLYARIGDRVGQADTEHSLAYSWERRRDYERALCHARRALDLYLAAGHHRGQAVTHNAVGWYLGLLGSHTEALTHCEQALPLLQRLGDRHGEGDTWDSLGYIHHHLGDQGRAAECYQLAIEAYRELGDRWYEADSHVHLGDAHHAAGQVAAARLAWQGALALLIELDHPEAAGIRAKLDGLDGP